MKFEVQNYFNYLFIFIPTVWLAKYKYRKYKYEISFFWGFWCFSILLGKRKEYDTQWIT